VECIEDALDLPSDSGQLLFCDWPNIMSLIISDDPITPEVFPGDSNPFTPLARDQKIKSFTSYP